MAIVKYTKWEITYETYDEID